jgi:PadR family transcriptional regulator PadR
MLEGGYNMIPVQFKKGILKLCVLALLHKGDCYGYQMVQKISERVEISEGTIYPLLQKLKQDGLVETYLVESREGPSRKYYRLTSQGRLEYIELKKGWSHFAERVNSMVEGEFNND